VSTTSGARSALKRIVVVGSSCSGKTTLARRLAGLLNLKHVELDAIHWGPNWSAAETEPFRRDVSRSLDDGNWVVDGNYSQVQDITWGRATTLIWLNYPFLTVFGRGLSRTIRRAFSKEPLFSGNQESFRQSFLSRNSILWWIIISHRRRCRLYRSLLDSGTYPNLSVIEFTRPRETDAFVDSLTPDPGASG